MDAIRKRYALIPTEIGINVGQWEDYIQYNHDKLCQIEGVTDVIRIPTTSTLLFSADDAVVENVKAEFNKEKYGWFTKIHQLG